MKGDRASNTLSDARNLRRLTSKRKVFNDFVGPDDQTDLLKFKLNKSSTVKLAAKRNRENISLELFEIDGNEKRVLRRIGDQDFDTDLTGRDIRRNLNRLARSNRRGKKGEKISIDLDAGTYYIRVSHAQRRGDGTRFRLSSKAIEISEPQEPSNPEPSNPEPSNPVDIPSWVRQFGSSGNDYAYGIDVDSSGNVYVAGTTEGTLPSSTNSGGQDNFVAKYDKSGALQWRRQFGTSDDDIIFDIAVDDSGNYYVAGATISEVDYSLSGISGGIDGFLAKYSSNGTQLWQSQIPLDRRQVDVNLSSGLGNVSLSNQDAGDAFSSIEIDASGNVYVSGFTKAVPAATENIGGIPVTVAENSANAFAAKYNGSNGSNIWFTEVSSSGSSAAADLAVDASGNVFIAGVTGAELQLDTRDPFLKGDAFVAKYDANGNLDWTSDVLASSNADAQDYARGIALDSSGNVYITGDTDGTLPGESAQGDTDGFIARYDSNGNRQWVTQFGTSSLDESQAIAIADDGTIFVAGESAGSLYATNIGGTDTFLATYDTNGNLLQSTQFGTAQDEEAYRLVTDSSNRPYLAGQTTGSLQGGISNAGSFDAWVYKNPSLT